MTKQEMKKYKKMLKNGEISQEEFDKLTPSVDENKVIDRGTASTQAVVGSVFFLIGIAIVFVILLCLFLYLLSK